MATFQEGDIVYDYREPGRYRGVVLTVLSSNRYRISWYLGSAKGVELFDSKNIEFLKKE